MSEIEIDIFVQEMTIKATEYTENFIFEVIRPYCEEVSKITVSKEYLKHLLTRSVPLSVIEEIKEKIDERYDIVKVDDIRYAGGLVEALDIIDSYINGGTE